MALAASVFSSVCQVLVLFNSGRGPAPSVGAACAMCSWQRGKRNTEIIEDLGTSGVLFSGWHAQATFLQTFLPQRCVPLSVWWPSVLSFIKSL